MRKSEKNKLDQIPNSTKIHGEIIVIFLNPIALDSRVVDFLAFTVLTEMNDKLFFESLPQQQNTKNQYFLISKS